MTYRSSIAFLLCLSACSTRAPDLAADQAAEATPYHRDVARICFAEQRSGALEQEESQRSIVVATWLGGQIETPEGRQLLVELARLAPPAKVERLRAESASAGLDGCPTVATWSPAGE